MVEFRFIVAGIVFVLQIVSAFMALFVIYLIITGDPKRILAVAEAHAAKKRLAKRLKSTPSLPKFAIVFIGSGPILLAGAALFVAQFYFHLTLLQEIIMMFLVLLFSSACYLLLFRYPLIEARVHYAIVLWVAFWMLCGTLLLFLWFGKDGLAFQNIGNIDANIFAQYVSMIFQLTGIIIAATMVVVTNRHNAEKQDETAQREIYQRLELSSVELFRFECDHPELVQLLWFPDRQGLNVAQPSQWPKEVTTYQLREYICQMLNLFEMACRFRLDGIVAPEIFGSWVIWMWELCNSRSFQEEWADDMHLNYIQPFSEIINNGIQLAPKQDEKSMAEEARRHFFKSVSKALGGCRHIDEWLEDHKTPVRPVTAAMAM